VTKGLPYRRVFDLDELETDIVLKPYGNSKFDFKRPEDEMLHTKKSQPVIQLDESASYFS
jgi:hypothetical protein